MKIYSLTPEQRERKLANDRARYPLIREKRHQQSKEYRIKNKEQISKYKKEYYEKFPEKKIQRYKRNSEFRKNNREKQNEYHRNYYKKNRLKSIAWVYSRINATKDLTVETIQDVYETNIKKYGTLTCYLCEKSIEFGQDSLEHKTPLSRGGNNQIDNLDVAHRICNSKKFTKTEEEFKKEIQNGKSV